MSRDLNQYPMVTICTMTANDQTHRIILGDSFVFNFAQVTSQQQQLEDFIYGVHIGTRY